MENGCFQDVFWRPRMTEMTARSRLAAICAGIYPSGRKANLFSALRGEKGALPSLPHKH